jgi:predicted Fe-Mo cluster-binding NifX family protein
MIAIPLDTETSTEISKKYGNAEFFALLDEGSDKYIVVKNQGCGNGMDTANFVKNSGVNSTVFYYMGRGVYDVLKEDLDVYTAGETHFTVQEIGKLVNIQSLKKLDNTNFDELLNSGESHCTCGCENNQ